jgi:PAS domain S-box-containing protein
MNIAAPTGLTESQETERLALLALTKWLDADTPPALQAIVRLAATLTGCSASVVHLVDAHRLYALARHGISSRHATRESSWCNQAITQTEPLCMSAPEGQPWRFYIGFPILVEGHALATFCVLNRDERQLTDAQKQTLKDLALIVQAQLAEQVEKRRVRREAARVRMASLAGSDWLWETNPDGHLQWVSASLRQHTGLDPVAEMGMRAKDIYTPAAADSGASWQRYVQARQRREPFSQALAERDTPRGRMVVSISGSPVFRKDGVFMGYRGASRNVTRQLQLEEEAHRQDALLREATETFHAGVMISAPDGRILLANKHWLASAGLSSIEGAPSWPDLLRQLIKAGHYPEAAGQEDDFYDLRIKQHHEDRARVIRLRDRMILARDQMLSNGNILHFATDVTQAHNESLVVEEQQLAVMASEARLKAVLDALPDLWFLIDEQGRYRDGHRNHPMMLKPFDELKGQRFGTFVSKELAEREWDAITRAHATGQAQRLEYSLTMPDGITRQFEGRMAPMPEGRTLFLTRDMTDIRALERDVRTLQQVLQADLSLGLLVSDARSPGHPVLYATPGGQALLGQGSGQLEGRPLLDVLQAMGENPSGQALLAHSIDSSLPCVAMLSRRLCGAGHAERDMPIEQTFELRLTPLKDTEGQTSHVIALVHDVSDRQVAAERLRLSEERWKFALEGAGDGVWDWDALADRTYYSSRCKTMLGLSEHELSDSPGALRERIHPEDLNRVVQAFNQYLESDHGVFQQECRLLHRDGHHVWVLSRGKVVARDAQGRPSRMVGTLTDITPLKQAEHALRDKLAAEAASKAKSEFLSRMSHEIRTPLNAVHGFAQLLKQRLDHSDRVILVNDLQDFAKRILGSSEHLNELVNEVLDLQQIESGIMALRPESCALQATLGQCLQMLKPMADRYRVMLCIAPECEPLAWHVWTDQRRLTQVINNLLTNAIKYNRPDGWVTVEVKPHGPTGVRVAVQDTGLGMDAGQLTRLFQPFERLGRDTSSIEGSGLGLLITRSLIQAMGGEIDIHSELGTGTRIAFTLPHASAQPMIEPPEPSHASVEGLSGTVSSPTQTQSPPPMSATSTALPPALTTAHSASHPLRVMYVEDNRINALLFQEALRDYEYIDLEVAEDGQMAMSTAREFKPHVLVVDAHLPGMSGFEVLRALRTLPGLADVPAYMCSADALPEDIARAHAEGFVGYWTKPIDIPEVVNTLSALAGQDPEQAHNAAS